MFDKKKLTAMVCAQKKIANNKERSTQYASNNYTKALPTTNF